VDVLYRLENLQFAYDRNPVLNGISAEIEKGDFLAFVGPNGAGKSTLLKILAGLLRRTRGAAEFRDRAISTYSFRELARSVAFVPQETHVVFPFTAGEMILMGRLPHRGSRLFETAQDIESARLAMQFTDTEELAGKRFNELSGGERQRVVLASALAQNPEVLLLDEPTAFLDLKHQTQFYNIVERLNVDRGVTIISVTHDVNLAAGYFRRMIALRGGRFIADGKPQEVLTPRNLYDIFEITANVLQRPDGRGPFIIQLL
jgi:iron complex transport system ATP-binding protein